MRPLPDLVCRLIGPSHNGREQCPCCSCRGLHWRDVVRAFRGRAGWCSRQQHGADTAPRFIVGEPMLGEALFHVTAVDGVVAAVCYPAPRGRCFSLSGIYRYGRGMECARLSFR